MIATKQVSLTFRKHGYNTITRDDLIEKGYKDLIYNKTGLLINPYFSASKIKYILDETNKYDEAKKGNILFGTIDTWLLWKFNKGHFTDVTNASRTMLYNINTLQSGHSIYHLISSPGINCREVI